MSGCSFSGMIVCGANSAAAYEEVSSYDHDNADGGIGHDGREGE